MACCRSWKKLSCRSRSRVMSLTRPQRRARRGDALERTHADAVPGRRAFAGQRRRHAQLLDRALAAARGLGQPVDRLGHFRRAGEQPLDQFEVGRALGARQDAIGVIGVDDARIGVGDDQPVAVAVGDGLGDVEAARRGRRTATGRRRRAESRRRRKSPAAAMVNDIALTPNSAGSSRNAATAQHRTTRAPAAAQGWRRDRPGRPRQANWRSCRTILPLAPGQARSRGLSRPRRRAVATGRARRGKGAPRPRVGRPSVSRIPPVFMTHVI